MEKITTPKNSAQRKTKKTNERSNKLKKKREK